MTKQEKLRQQHLEMDILQCHAARTSRSLGDVRDWIGRHATLFQEDRRTKRFDSGKETPVYAIAVGNCLTRITKNNSRGRGLVESLSRDRYSITDMVRNYLLAALQAQKNFELLLGDISMND